MPALPLRLLLVSCALAMPGCLKADPNHCANVEGDATCVSEGMGNFCSICTATKHGCTMQQPEPDCHRPGSGTTTTETMGSSSTTDATTSTGPAVDCMGAGFDAACPEATPFCVDGVCTDCTGGPELCATADAATPVCFEPPGLCVGCLSDDVCGEEMACNGGYACAPCTEHEHCAIGACDLDRGQCMAEDTQIVFVDNTTSACVNDDTHVGEGTANDPYCAIGSVLPTTETGKNLIVFLQGGGDPYNNPIRADHRGTVAVIGAGRPSVEGAAQGVRSAVQGTRLYVDGVRLTGDDLGADCLLDGRLWLDDSLIHANDAHGVIADRCTALVIRRSRIYANADDGIELNAGSDLRLLASGVTGNGTDTLDTRGLDSNASTFELLASTIVGNISLPLFEGGPAPINLDCVGGMGGPVRNSIIANAAANSINCQWASIETSVVDTETPGATDVVVIDSLDSAWFSDLMTGQVTLAGPASTPFGGVAVWQLGDPRYDIEATLRTPIPGASEYAGADQP